jgi:hypothetical protein
LDILPMDPFALLACTPHLLHAMPHPAPQKALLIAEDTSHHEPNVLWWWDIAAEQLTRIATAPYGAEVTGVGIFNFNGWSYIWANMQHPYEGGCTVPSLVHCLG